MKIQLTQFTHNRLRSASTTIEAGFSLIELSIVLAIFLIAAAIAVPNVPVILENIKIRGAAQELSGFYQQARMRAVQDNSYYEVVATTAPFGAFLDLSGNGVAAGNPMVQLPGGVSMSNAGVPLGLNQTTLGFTPVLTETSLMFGQDGVQRPGLAWNSRGLPCQRPGPTSPCQTGIGWLQYLQYEGTGGRVAYAAVSVSPASRVKIWTYSGGVWR